MIYEKLDWAGLMHLGLHQLGMPVDEFWALTPNELSIKLGHSGAKPAGMGRKDLSELLARYPDRSERVKNG